MISQRSFIYILFLTSLSIGYSKRQHKHRPRNITVTSHGINEILVTWEAPRVNTRKCGVRNYFIYVKLKEDEEITKIVVPSEERRYLIQDLSQNSKYFVRLETETCNGASIPTKWFRVVTSIILMRPLEVRFSTTKTTITVSWQPPSTGKVDKYVIGYGESTPNTHWMYARATDRNFTISNLDPGKLYIITLRAERNNIAGETIIVSQNTKDGAAVVQPKDISATLVTSTSMVITWQDPELHDEHVPEKRYYIVDYRSTDQGAEFEMESSKRRVTLKDLTPDTNYQITIKTVNKNKEESMYSLPLYVTTQMSLQMSNEPPPETLSLTRRRKRKNSHFRTKVAHHVTAVIHWPEDDTARSFSIRYRRQDSGGGGGGGGGGVDTHWEQQQTNDNFAMLERLRPFRVYEYQLRTVSHDGAHSDWSLVSYLSTKDEL